MKVLIISTGNVGNAFAATLSQRHEVRLWADPEHPGSTTAIRKNGYLDAIRVFEGRHYPTIMEDLQQAVQGTSAVLVTIPTIGIARETLMEKFKTCDLQNSILIWILSNMSSFLAQNSKFKLKIRATIDTATSPFGCRMRDDAVFIKSIKEIVGVATYGGQAEQSLRHQIAEFFPSDLEWFTCPLEIGFMNMNFVVHPIATIMNAGRIESTGGDFKFFAEVMMPSVVKTITFLYQTRLEIMKRLGFNQLSFLDIYNRWYGTTMGDFQSFSRSSRPHNLTSGSPTNMNHRYLTEDCCMLALISEMGNLFGIDTKSVDSVLWFASEISGVNFIK